MADSRQDNRDSAADLDEIAAKAIETRSHLVAALEGLDEIIRLATRQGREDIVEAAEQSRQATVKAAGAFNADVTGKPVNQIDPIKVDEADEAATQADEDIKRLVAALESRVSDLETHRDRMHALLRINEEGESTRLTDLEAFQVQIAETVGNNTDLVERVSALETDMAELTHNMPRENGRLPAILTVVHTTVDRSVTRVTESAKVNWMWVIVAFVVTWLVMFGIAWALRGFIAGTTPFWVWAMSVLAAIIALGLPLNRNRATEDSSAASTRTETAPAGSRGDRRNS